MRKRTLISIILTIVLVIVLKHFWLYKNPVQFEWSIFVILLILIFLILYKLMDYVADFKTVKGKSRIDIVFLIIFFTFLIIPSLWIDRNMYSLKENRALAKWESLFSQDKKINYDFGKNFEQWFNDRFNLRYPLISTHNLITFKLTSRSGKRYYEKERQIVYDDVMPAVFEEERLKNLDNLLEFNKYCEKHGIDLYILVVPPKEDIYPPLNPPYRFVKKLDNYKDKIKQLNSQGCKIIDLMDVMKKEAAINDEYLFFKTEHHWTDEGAFIGYQEVMKEITKKYSDVKVLTKDDFDYFYNNKIRGEFARRFAYGQTARLLSLPRNYLRKLHKTKYKYYKHKDFDNLSVEVFDVPKRRGKLFYYPKGAPYKAILLGTSQCENLMEFVPFTFRDVKRLRTNNIKATTSEDNEKIIKYYEQDILDFQPDIIIFCITYWNMDDLHRIFEKD